VLQFVCNVVKDTGKEEYLSPFIRIGLDCRHYGCIVYMGSTAVGKMRNCGMWNAKVKCGIKTVERCCGTVGKMRNAEIAYVDDRMSTGGHS